MRICLLFAGQGSQKIGMGKSLLGLRGSKELVEEAEEALKKKISRVMFDGLQAKGGIERNDLLV
jgi:malonyl CoA-acyl carrier protein transacylase